MPDPAPIPADQFAERLVRVEEALGFTDHTAGQLSAEIAELSRRLAEMQARIQRLESRFQKLLDAADPDAGEAES